MSLISREKKISYRGIERRKFRRLNTPMPVRFSLLEDQVSELCPRAMVGRTRDVSPEGLCLETNTVMCDGTHILAEAMGHEKRLLMAIAISDSDDPWEVFGRVIWYDLAPEGSDHRFRAGVSFIELSKEARKKWRGFLSREKKDGQTDQPQKPDR